MAENDHDGGQGPKSDPRGLSRPSVIPPAQGSKNLPHRDRRLFTEQRRVSLLAGERTPEPTPSAAPSNRYGGYTQEVKRRNLLEDEPEAPVQVRVPTAPTDTARGVDGNPFGEAPRTGVGPAFIPPAPRLPTSAATSRMSASPSMPRASLPSPNASWPRTSSSLPPAPRPPSVRPPSANPSFNAPERRSLGGALKAFLRGSEQAPPDPRFAQAQELLNNARRVEACLRLEDLLADVPDHAPGRALLLALAMDMKQEDRIRANVDHAFLDHARAQDHEGLCELYRSVRTAYPQMAFAERALLAVLVAGEKAAHGRVVVDVTKLLLRDFPQSQALPRAFMASAQVQQSEGRIDMARNTLETLLARFPYDALATVARQKLAELK